MRRKTLLLACTALALITQQACTTIADGETLPVTDAPQAIASSTTEDVVEKKGVMFMNRIGPGSSELYISNADGTNERKLLGENTVFEYSAELASDGTSVYFTSERNGDGNSELFKANIDGSNIEEVVSSSSVEDAVSISPDGKKIAFVSTREGYFSNVWIKDLETGELTNLTGAEHIQGDPMLPNSFLRPSWSPDGKWIAFSSDRNTNWRGHDYPIGWEHTQELSIYVIGADGQNFRRLVSKPEMSYGSPSWSPDGKRISFYAITTEDTWGARRYNLVQDTTSQIASVDVETGRDYIEHTSGKGVKISPVYISNDKIGYVNKGPENEGIYYTDGSTPILKKNVREPIWTQDGSQVIYEQVDHTRRPDGVDLYSWDPEWEYKHIDVFPLLSSQDEIVISDKKNIGNLVVLDRDGKNPRTIYEVTKESTKTPYLLGTGLVGAYQPSWSRDGEWVTFCVGTFFYKRYDAPARVMMVRRDGTGLREVTHGEENAGFPSFSADGKEIVYRVWDKENIGLRIYNIEKDEHRVLTETGDNLPAYSPDGTRILFTRRHGHADYDLYTIKPDGTDLVRLTTHPSGDGHAVWSNDGSKIMWSGSVYGFRDEAALYDDTFQQYGQIWVMNADGSNKHMVTDSKWEDSMPLYVPYLDQEK
ncbi:PD40 domain-containing protein [Hirschia baltica]|uniref:WD40 domain protein beta Propeller n=1 Tax=Hirschia baltica (strain ATCC 49814 / DSM 5838 / IFAM 1418) TaxID=582402 RepID=C6XPM5_HIRBI|nr:PD40 domain-containing protein [Hirschia baltica]ACT60290.1 WD40 domain protein beta Propeller [Hirschia baltica ATCC 49814]